MYLPIVVALSCLAGICFAGIGISYKAGEKLNIRPMQSFCFASVLGCVLFTLCGLGTAGEAPWYFFAAAFGGGFTQYLVVWLLQKLLKLGPLSPAWSSLMLSFVVVILFSSVFLHEPFDGWNFAALAVALLAVLSAALSNSAAEEGGRGGSAGCGRSGAGRRFMYGGLLVVLLVTNSALGCSMKLLGSLSTSDGFPLMERCANLYLGVMYAGIALPLAFSLCRIGGWNFSSGWKWVTLAALAASGTMGGMLLQALLLDCPAALYFTCSSCASVLFAAIFSAMLFHEKRTVWWYGTVLFTLTAIFLSNGGAFFD
ncbi:MAG: hypothetical protein PHI85_09655 [Victivallaceae bacterium]|nr:hypothetical protein [Victivallaceae bacterium]